MAVEKPNGFRAPYRSQAFQRQAAELAGRSGVLSIDGEIGESGGTVTIPPLTFLQQGLIVRKTVQTDIPLPTMAAPFFLVATAATPAQVDDVAFQFAKSPEDISLNEVILSEFDGDQWRQPPLISIEGVYRDVNAANIEYGRVGPYSGLLTTYSAPDYTTAPGVLIDPRGERTVLSEAKSFTEFADDSEGTWQRVDRIAYRLPLDDEKRIGTRQLLLGGSFSGATVSTVNLTAFADSSVPREKVRTVIGADNTAHVFASSGYGTSFDVVYAKYSADRATELVAPVSIVSGMTTDEFDVAIDKNDDLHVTYITGNNVEVARFDDLGAALGAATVVDGSTNIARAPRIFAKQDFVYVTYQREEGASNNQIFFSRVSITGPVATAASNVTGAATNLESPDIFVSDDLRVYLAWQNSVTGEVFYQVFDDIGSPLLGSTPVLVSDNTEQIGVGTLVNVASAPKIWVTGNREVFVAFRQDKGGAVFGISVWHDGAAFMTELVAPGENFERFDLYVDDIYNGIHLLAAQAGQADYVKVEEKAAVFAETVAATATQGLAITRDLTGSMLHLWSAPDTGTFTDYETGFVISDVGPDVVGSENVAISSAQFLTSSAGWAQAPKAGDEVTISGSGSGNNGTFIISVVELVSRNAPASDDSYRFTATGAAFTAETGVTGDFAEPDGNTASFVKSTSEIDTRAYRYGGPPSDILLARILRPGPVVLNYIPPGGAGVVNSDLYTIFGTGVTLDWESTTPGELTTVGSLKIADLVNNLDYTLVAGGFPMVEGDALYVTLDGVDLNPTPQVSPIASLPFGNPIQVLGAIKDGQFAPNLLGVAGIGALDSGEAVVVSNDLAPDSRTRLGLTSDTAVEPYTSNIGSTSGASYPSIISQTNIMAGQNKHVEFVKARVSWDGTNLVILEEGFVSVPGIAESRNRIAPQTIAGLDADGKVAHVDINRVAGIAADLTVNTIDIASLALTRDKVILARRLAGSIIIGSTVINPGQTVDIDDPFPGPLKMKEHPTTASKIVMQSSKAVKMSGSSQVQTLSNLLLDFDGAVIRTSGAPAGEVYDATDTALISSFSIPAASGGDTYRWFSVAMIGVAVTTDNQIEGRLSINPGSSDNAVLDDAPKPAFIGDLPIGWFYLKRDAGDTAYENITKANFLHLSPGAGSGGGAGDPSFTIERVVGEIATLNGGYIRTVFAEELASGSGTDETTVGVDLNLNLTTILGAAPAADTTYYLYIDRQTLADAVTLTDSGRDVITVDTANFVLLTGKPGDGISPARFTHIAMFRTNDDATPADRWVGTGASTTAYFNNAAKFQHDVTGAFFKVDEPFVHEITSAATHVVPHGLSGEPQLVMITYQDAGGEKNGVNMASTLLDKNATDLKIDTNFFSFASSQKIIVEAYYKPDLREQFAGVANQFETGWFENTATTSVLHGLVDRNAIKDISVLEWDTTAGRIRTILASDLVVNWDDDTIYLDWTGLTPSATLRYRVVSGGTPLPSAVPKDFGGFNKFVGAGPGSYQTLADAFASAAPGDSILVFKGYEITAKEVLAADNVRVKAMPGVAITITAGADALEITGNECEVDPPKYIQNHAGAMSSIFKVGGNSNFVDKAKFESLSGSVVAMVELTALSNGNWVNAVGQENGGTITASLSDSGTANSGDMRKY